MYTVNIKCIKRSTNWRNQDPRNSFGGAPNDFNYWISIKFHFAKVNMFIVIIIEINQVLEIKERMV